MLPNDYRVLIQVADVGSPDSLRVLLHDHPAKVGVKKTLADGVRVLVGVGVSMMGTMISGPPSDGSFDSSTTSGSKEYSQRQCGGIGTVRPKPMVAGGDTESGCELYK